ncbi:hypothetical protein SEA_ENYGMA_176 [Streptomyces phage Enygma]
MGLFGKKVKPAFVKSKTLTPKKTVRLSYFSDSGPAVSLQKISNVNLRKEVESTAKVIKKGGALGVKWSVLGAVDTSGSMGNLYRTGSVQTVTDRALAFTLSIDEDGFIPFATFGERFQWRKEVGQNDYQNLVRTEKWDQNLEYGTVLAKTVLEMMKLAKGADTPVYAFIITDGEPTDGKENVFKAIQAASQYPIFFKFLAVGGNQGAINFLNELDNMEKTRPGSRLFDNVDTAEIPDPKRVSTEQFAAMMTEEMASTIQGMRDAGLVTG